MNIHKIIFNLTETLFVGMVLLFISPCSSQQVSQRLEKTLDRHKYQSTNSLSNQLTSNNKIAPLIIYFKADPPYVANGNSTTLKWRTQNVSSAIISDIGRVKVNGTHEVTPKEAIIYKLTAISSTGHTINKVIKINHYALWKFFCPKQLLQCGKFYK